jgi:hypothetical protein
MRMYERALWITALVLAVVGCVAPGEDGLDDDDDEVTVESESALSRGVGGKVAAQARSQVGRACSEFLPYCQRTTWCVVFVNDAFSRGGAASQSSWSVQGFEKWAFQRGTYKAGTKGLAPGDALVWADGSHVGVFIGSTKSGKLRVASGGMGDVVVRHTVAASAIKGYVRPR